MAACLVAYPARSLICRWERTAFKPSAPPKPRSREDNDVGEALSGPGGVEETRLSWRGRLRKNVRRLGQGPRQVLGQGSQAHPLDEAVQEGEERHLRPRRGLDQMVR